MTEPTNWEVAEAMRRYGGSFVAALGEAIHKADAGNVAKIKATFGEYWAKYAELARNPPAQGSDR